MKCSRCGAKMVLRSGKYGRFWGCSKYPKCKNTENYSGPELTEEACQSGELQCLECPYQGTDDCFLFKDF